VPQSSRERRRICIFDCDLRLAAAVILLKARVVLDQAERARAERCANSSLSRFPLLATNRRSIRNPRAIKQEREQQPSRSLKENARARGTEPFIMFIKVPPLRQRRTHVHARVLVYPVRGRERERERTCISPSLLLCRCARKKPSKLLQSAFLRPIVGEISARRYAEVIP